MKSVSALILMLSVPASASAATLWCSQNKETAGGISSTQRVVWVNCVDWEQVQGVLAAASKAVQESGVPDYKDMCAAAFRESLDLEETIEQYPAGEPRNQLMRSQGHTLLNRCNGNLDRLK